MENTRKLELTLCGMLPYGLKAKCIDDELANGWDSMSQYKKGYIFEIDNEDLNCDISKHYKPLLHSLDKLTEPILDGGLVPIKVLGWEYYDGQLGNLEYCLYGESPRVAINPLDYLNDLEQLKEWHFNVYSLDAEYYIEKSTI